MLLMMACKKEGSMKFLKDIKKQAGFSLTEVLISMGILGGIIFVAMKLMGDQSSNQSYVKGRAEVDKTVALVASHLADRKRCDAFVKGIRINAPIAKIATKLPDGGEKVILQSAAQSSPAVDYGDFYMDYNSIYIESDPAIEDQANVVLRFRLKNSSFLKTKNENDSSKASQDYDQRSIIEKKIPVPIVRNFIQPVIIDSCGQKVGSAEAKAREAFCTSLGEGFSWNVLTSECMAKEKNCPIGQIVVKVTSLGNYECGNAPDHVILSNVFDLESEKNCPSGFSLQQNSATKKIEIKCN